MVTVQKEDLVTATATSRDSTYPKISIVTPSYNQGEFIEEAILSVINQNYPNLEYIIIDGGSTDNTVEIIKKYEKQITYWVSESDQGQSHAISKGLAKCTGDIFSWINSDDYYSEGALKVVGESFADANTQVLCGYSRMFSDDKDININSKLIATTTQGELEKDLVSHYFIQPSTFFRRSVVTKLGGLSRDLHYVMDSELWLKYLLAYQYSNIRFTDILLANYRLHESSKTVAQRPKFEEEMRQVTRHLCKSLKFSSEEIDLLVGQSQRIVQLGRDYPTSQVSERNFKSYAYQHALFKTGLKDSSRFFRLLKRVLLLCPFSIKLYKDIFYKIILSRLLHKLRNVPVV